MALVDDLLFEETERPTMAEFNERLGTIGGKLDTAAFLNALKTAVVDGEGNELLSIPGVQIETGSYTGTGTYGSSNPNRLTFSAPPRLIFIFGPGRMAGGGSDTPSGIVIMVNGKYRGDSNLENTFGTANFVGNTASWYGTWSGSGGDPYGPQRQMNYASDVYNYVAFTV